MMYGSILLSPFPKLILLDCLYAQSWVLLSSHTPFASDYASDVSLEFVSPTDCAYTPLALFLPSLPPPRLEPL